MTFHLTNTPSGRVHFEKGIHRLAYFINQGNFSFEDTHWHLGQDSPVNQTVFASDEFLEEVSFLDHVDLREGTFAAYQVDSSLVFPQDLTYRLAYTPEHIEVLGDLHLPLLESTRPRSLSDLTNVICHGETHVALPSLTLTEDLTLESLKSLHIVCSEFIKIQARLKACELFINGQKGFDLGTDNTHLGEIAATEGRLVISLEEALNARYGNLYSRGNMRLHSEGDRVDLGEMVSKTSSQLGGYYTTYDPNNTFVSTNGSLDIYAAKGGSNKSLIWVGENLRIQIPTPEAGQEDHPFANTAGHIIVWGDCDLDVRTMINNRMPYVRFNTPVSGAYTAAFCEDMTSRAAQLHVHGHLNTQAPTFHNMSSLVRVAGNFTGDGERLYQAIQQGGAGVGWRNIKEILSRNGHHYKEGWHCQSHPSSRIEPQIMGIFSVGGDFIPPTNLARFESSGLIEARMAHLMVQGPLVLGGDGTAERSSVQIRALDEFMPQNGLFEENSGPLGPVIQERFSLGGDVSTAPRLIIPSPTRRLALEGSPLAHDMPRLPRDYLSPAALTYTLMTGILPLLPRQYQNLNPLDLLTTLQTNSVSYLKNLSLLRGSDPLYCLEGPTESVPNTSTLMLRDSAAFTNAPNVTEPMMAFVEEEVNGETVLSPYIALPEKTLKSGVTSTEEAFEATAETVQLTGALIQSLNSYVDIHSQGQILTLPFYERRQYSGGKRTTITETIPHVTRQGK